ncbi:hypothetical protein ACFQU2_16295 [Siccirubricoccus deserti]
MPPGTREEQLAWTHHALGGKGYPQGSSSPTTRNMTERRKLVNDARASPVVTGWWRPGMVHGWSGVPG